MITVEIDISEWLKTAELILRKLPYATNNAITRVAKEAVIACQNEIAADFTIRKRFIIQRFKILVYSTVHTLEATIGIDANSVQGSPLLIGFFEQGQGGAKPVTHGTGLAVPLTGTGDAEHPARPTFQSLVPTAYKYQNLKLEANAKGKKKTFIVPGVGVFQRIRPGKDPGAIALIYAFETNITLKPRMNLHAIAADVVSIRIGPIWREEFAKEVTRQRR